MANVYERAPEPDYNRERLPSRSYVPISRAHFSFGIDNRHRTLKLSDISLKDQSLQRVDRSTSPATAYSA